MDDHNHRGGLIVFGFFALGLMARLFPQKRKKSSRSAKLDVTPVWALWREARQVSFFGQRDVFSPGTRHRRIRKER
jgi:hypothetical protein